MKLKAMTLGLLQWLLAPLVAHFERLFVLNLVMRSEDFRAVVEPVLNEVFDGVYDQRADEWKGCFEERPGIPRSYHEEPVLYGFSAAPELPEGTPVSYQQGGTLFIKRYNYGVYGLAFALTKVLVEDGDHIRIGSIFSRQLAQANIETKETLIANVLNRAFNGTYTGGDGVALNVSNHPLGPGAGTASNLLATSGALSQTTLEQMLIQIRNAVDNNGKRIRLNALKLVVSPSNIFQAEVIVKSVLRSGVANNDINPIRSLGMLSQETCTMSRLTSTTAWWVKTNEEMGLSWMKRRDMERSMEGDFETDSMRYKATFRGREGWTNWRTVWGTPGT